MSNTEDTRRYRDRQTGEVYRVSVQARSPSGPVTLVKVDNRLMFLDTTNDRLAVDFEPFNAEPTTRSTQ